MPTASIPLLALADGAHQGADGGQFATPTTAYMGLLWYGPSQVGLRFVAPTNIVAGATINTAELRLVRGTESGGTGTLRYSLKSEDRQNPPAFAPGVGLDVVSRTRGLVVAEATFPDPGYLTPFTISGLAPILQDIVTRRGGIAAGEAIVIFMDQGNSSGQTDAGRWISARLFHATASDRPVLSLDWTEGAPPPPDTTPPVISGVSATPADTSAVVAFLTDESAYSQVEYGPTALYGSITPLSVTPATAHSVQLVGLAPGTLYHYRAIAVDLAGNQAASLDGIFTTTAAPPPDTTPPAISGVSATPGETSATIAFNTDEPATRDIEYGTSPAFGLSTGRTSTLATAHQDVLAGLAPDTRYDYRIHAWDASNNEATFIGFFTTLAAPPPPPSGNWPTRVDLAVDEGQSFTFSDGVPRQLTLLGYTVVSDKHWVEATVRVVSPSLSVTKTILVGFSAVPIALNGLRVYAYVWKEADDGGLELVGQQGGLPLAAGKDVGFLVSDPRLTMFPLSSPVANIPFHVGAFNQSWLEPNVGSEAHSGYDIGLVVGDMIFMPYDGTVYYNGNFVNGFGETDGQVTIVPDFSPGAPSQFGSAQSWAITHLNVGAPLFPNGTHVLAGTPIATVARSSTPPHAHIGSKSHFDGGSWRWAAEVWEGLVGRNWPAPRNWLILGAYPGGIATNVLAPDESGGIGTIAPRIGDVVAGKAWKLGENFVRSVARMGEMVSVYPYSGNSDRDPQGSIGYAAIYVYSPLSQPVTLLAGATDSIRAWLNGSKVLDHNSGRYATYDVLTQPAVVVDQFSGAVNLAPGWNTLIVKSNMGSRAATAWMFSLKCGNADGTPIPGVQFSTRSIGLTLTDAPTTNSISVAWQAVNDPNSQPDRYEVDVSETISFATYQTFDAGSGTLFLVNGLLPGRTYHIRVRPVNDADMGGATYWQHADMITASTAGTISYAPAQVPPAGLTPAQTPQFVVLGMDDNPNSDTSLAIAQMLNARRNWVGTLNPRTFDDRPMTMSYYLIGLNVVNPTHAARYVAMYGLGHELGNHSYSHDPGLMANYAAALADYLQADNAIRQMLIDGGVPVAEVDARRRNRRGAREPQDAFSPASVQAEQDLGYEYNCSHRSGHTSNLPPWYPGTLEAGWPGAATWDTQVIGNHPGMWEIPQLYWVINPATGETGGYCDADHAVTPAERVQRMQWTVERSLNGNRAPVGVCMHDGNWRTAEAQVALASFLDWCASQPDVRVVSHAELLDWMIAPEPLGVAPPPDLPPEITGELALPTAVSATITWSTNEPATSQVEYGTNPALLDQATPSDPAMVTAHAVTIVGLMPSTTYYFRAVSVDAGGNTGVGSVIPFVTEASGGGAMVAVNVDTLAVLRAIPPTFPGAAAAQWRHPAGQPALGIGEIPHLLEMSKLGHIWTLRFGGGLWANRVLWTRDNVAEQDAYNAVMQAYDYRDSDPLTPWVNTSQTYGAGDGFPDRTIDWARYKHVYTPSQMDSVARFRNATGAHVVIQANVCDNRPTMWADMVRYCNLERGYGFKYWELGNELDYDPGSNFRVYFGSNHLAAAAEYVRRFIRYSTAMSAVDPSIVYGVPVLANLTGGGGVTAYTWTDALLSEMQRQGVNMDWLSTHMVYVYHYYQCVAAEGPVTPDIERGWNLAAQFSYNQVIDGLLSTGDNLGAPGTVLPDTHWIMVIKRRFQETGLATLVSKLLSYLPRKPEIFLTEMRSVALAGQEPLHRWPGTVAWSVDAALRMMRAGADAVNWYDLYDAAPVTAQIVAPLSEGGAGPIIYGHIMLSELLGSVLLGATVDEAGYGAFASRDARGTWIHLINPNSAARQVSVAVTGETYSVGRYWSLEHSVPADAVATAQQVSLNGYVVTPAASADANKAALYAAALPLALSGGNSFTLDMAPYSAAVVFLGNSLPTPKTIPPPSAAIVPPTATTVNVGEVVNFISASAGSITNLVWDWGDGTQGFGAIASHAWGASGTYTVQHSAVGPGGTDTASILITVLGPSTPPVADFAFSVPDPLTPRRIAFQDLSLGEVTGWAWDLDGDGFTDAAAQNPVVTYPAVGVYQVTLTATGPGGSNSRTRTVTVTDLPLPTVADFTVTLPNPTDPLLVQFVDASQNATTWSWDFNADGVPESTDRNPLYRFPASGTYTVTLTVTGPSGTDSRSLVITITPPPASGGISVVAVAGGVGVALLILVAMMGKKRR